MSAPPHNDIRAVNAKKAAAEQLRARWLTRMFQSRTSEHPTTIGDLLNYALTDHSKALRKIRLHHALEASTGMGRDACLTLVSRVQKLSGATSLPPADVTVGWVVLGHNSQCRLMALAEVLQNATHPHREPPWPGFPYAPRK